MITILIDSEYGFGKYKSFFSKASRFILKELGLKNTELSLSLVGQDRIKELNLEHRKLNKVTDVLSFPLFEYDGVDFEDALMLGDVVISIPQAIVQATRHDVTVDDEFLRLLIHGILHLLGYDHVGNANKAKVMRAKEEAIFKETIKEF